MGGSAPAISRRAGRRGMARVLGVAVGCGAWLMTAASGPSLAATSTVSVTQGSLKLTPSANPKAGSPMTITETGQVGLTSTLQVFVQLGRACAADQNQEAAVGAIHVDQRVIPGSSAPFNVTSVFTPATAGSYFICGYLDGASSGSEVSQTTSVVVVVAPAASPPAGAPPGLVAGPAPAGIGTPAGTCVVPVLVRHSLAGARHLLGVAGCSLGVILRPSARGIARDRRRPGGRSLVLVVGSQFPGAGAKLRSNQYVAIRLVLGRAPGPRAPRGG